MKSSYLLEAQDMADKITRSLEGSGIWGVEFFIGNNQVYFSELSPRPHDTGLVTLISQNLNISIIYNLLGASFSFKKDLSLGLSGFILPSLIRTISLVNLI